MASHFASSPTVIRLLALLVGLAFLFPGGVFADHVPDQEVVVVAVIDGDTIDLQLSDGSVFRVRYIGIDTPETRHPTRGVECFGPEASARNRELVSGNTVWIERDISDVDRFGRLVRYVWLGDQLVESILLAEGYARAYPFRPDTSRAQEFGAIEGVAREQGQGLWSACAAMIGPSDLDDETVPLDVPVLEPVAPVAPGPTPAPAGPPVGRRTGRPLPYDPSGPDRDCGDFRDWATAQDFFEAAGGPDRDPHRLDSDRDGIAYETLPGAPRR